LNLYYKERNEIKTILTRFGPALPLTSDPPVRLHVDQKGRTTIKITISRAFLPKTNCFGHPPTIYPPVVPAWRAHLISYRIGTGKKISLATSMRRNRPEMQWSRSPSSCSPRPHRTRPRHRCVASRARAAVANREIAVASGKCRSCVCGRRQGGQMCLCCVCK
jgi:hypothetical protein